MNMHITIKATACAEQLVIQLIFLVLILIVVSSSESVDLTLCVCMLVEDYM